MGSTGFLPDDPIAYVIGPNLARAVGTPDIAVAALNAVRDELSGRFTSPSNLVSPSNAVRYQAHLVNGWAVARVDIEMKWEPSGDLPDRAAGLTLVRLTTDWALPRTCAVLKEAQGSASKRSTGGTLRCDWLTCSPTVTILSQWWMGVPWWGVLCGRRSRPLILLGWNVWAYP